MDGIYVPMTRRGIKEISYDEYKAGLANNVCSGMDAKQTHINQECDDRMEACGFNWQKLPDMRSMENFLQFYKLEVTVQP